jgi:hypothetical protein
MVLCGLVGLSLGLSNATWQNSVETGQVLAGKVKYPPDNPFYAYHLKAFSIVNHLSAALLCLTDSEKIVSIIISGLLGVVSFQAIGMFIFALNRSICMSVLGAVLIYFANYTGHGAVYSIWLLGTPATFGVLGLSFVVLTMALIGARAYKAGLFCLGLAPAIHPAMAGWLFMILFFSSFFRWGFAKSIIIKHHRYFVAGLLITIAALTYQLHVTRALPGNGSEPLKKHLDSYVQYWDSHREGFYWDADSGKTYSSKFRGVLFGIYGLATAFLGFRYFRKHDSLVFILVAIVISAILSLLLSVATQLPARMVPSLLLISMPGRYINLSDIVMAATLLGMLTTSDNRSYIGNYNTFIFLLAGSFFSRHFEVQIISLTVVLFWLVYVTMKKDNLWQKTLPLPAREHRISYEKLLCGFLCIFLLISVPSMRFVERYVYKKGIFKDRTNNEFYHKVAQRDGLMVVADFSMMPLKTRRPVLTDISSPNFFLYAFEYSADYNYILQKVYGIDLLIPPPRRYRHKEIPMELYKIAWETRTTEEWRQIRNEFNVTDVLTPDDWVLSLPVVVAAEKMILYTIPPAR